MSFPVFPQNYRRMSCIFCLMTAVIGSLETILIICAMYFQKQAQDIVVAAFLFAVILTILSWRTCSITVRCNQHVDIQSDTELIILYSATGKALRTFSFSDIANVRVVDLPMIRYNASMPAVHMEPHICVTSASQSVETENISTSIDVRNAPNCIVFAYNQYAYDTLQHVLPNSIAD